MDFTDLSIVMPCYNYGAFLPEALESVAEAAAGGAEVLVVDDGSDDEQTLQALENLPAWVTLIRRKKGGPAAARNSAIAIAKGSLIFPLDSDDIANFNFLVEAIKLFSRHSNVDIVYGDCMFFGEKTGRWNADACAQKSLYVNGLNVSAMYRKKVWQTNTGYDEAMVHGYEDWEFWLHALKNKMVFVKAKEHAFNYRIRSKSLVNTETIPNHQELLKYMHHKHHDYMLKRFIDMHRELNTLKTDYRFLTQALFRLFFKKFKI